MLRCAVLALIIALAPPRAIAQDSAPPPARVVTVRFAGVADAAPCVCYDGSSTLPAHRALFVAAVGMRWPLLGDDDDRLQLGYVAELLPLVVSRGTANAAYRVFRCANGKLCVSVDSPDPWTTNTVGVGILPIGVVSRLRVSRALHLQLRVSGGVIRLSRPVPLLQGRKLNFAAEGGPAVELRLGDRQSLVAGLAFNHISNAGTSRVNPGMNSRLFEVGYQLRR
jgi:hypothetical protein